MKFVWFRWSRRDRSTTVGAVGGAALVAVALVLGGCSSGDISLAKLPSASTSAPSSAAPTDGPSASASSPQTTTPTSGTTLEGANLVTLGVAPPADAALAQVFQAYVEFWQADMTALTKSDPGWAPLLERLSGQQKADTVALLTRNRDKGQKITGTITLQPQVLAAPGSVATVRDCVDLSRTQAVNSAGQAVDGSKGKPGVEYSVTMTKVGSTWTVSNIDGVEGPGCAG